MPGPSCVRAPGPPGCRAQRLPRQAGRVGAVARRGGAALGRGITGGLDEKVRVCVVDADPAAPLRDRRSEKAQVARSRAPASCAQRRLGRGSDHANPHFLAAKGRSFRPLPTSCGWSGRKRASPHLEPSWRVVSLRPPRRWGLDTLPSPHRAAAVSAGRCVGAPEPQRQPQETRRQLSP